MATGSGRPARALRAGLAGLAAWAVLVPPVLVTAAEGGPVAALAVGLAAGLAAAAAFALAWGRGIARIGAEGLIAGAWLVAVPPLVPILVPQPAGQAATGAPRPVPVAAAAQLRQPVLHLADATLLAAFPTLAPVEPPLEAHRAACVVPVVGPGWTVDQPVPAWAVGFGQRSLYAPLDPSLCPAEWPEGRAGGTRLAPQGPDGALAAEAVAQASRRLGLVSAVDAPLLLPGLGPAAAVPAAAAAPPPLTRLAALLGAATVIWAAITALLAWPRRAARPAGARAPRPGAVPTGQTRSPARRRGPRPRRRPVAG